LPTVRRAGPLIAAALLAAWLPAIVAARSEEVMTAASGVTYVSGGAGTEAVDRLRSMEKDFNLKLVFAMKNGEYVADVRVTVVDATNKVVPRCHVGRTLASRAAACGDLSGQCSVRPVAGTSLGGLGCGVAQDPRFSLANRVT
jgi:hypothetical protein